MCQITLLLKAIAIGMMLMDLGLPNQIESDRYKQHTASIVGGQEKDEEEDCPRVHFYVRQKT